jgi:hypothetical protein
MVRERDEGMRRQAELPNPEGSARVALILCNQVKPLLFQIGIEAVRHLLNKFFHNSVDIKGI